MRRSFERQGTVDGNAKPVFAEVATQLKSRLQNFWAEGPLNFESSIMPPYRSITLTARSCSIFGNFSMRISVSRTLHLPYRDISRYRRSFTDLGGVCSTCDRGAMMNHQYCECAMLKGGQQLISKHECSLPALVVGFCRATGRLATVGERFPASLLDFERIRVSGRPADNTNSASRGQSPGRW
jgi:hypothetical protein